jgi:lipoprotein LprG
MAGIKSVKADAKFGPGVTLQGLTLTTASSSVQLPDQSDTLFKVKQGDFLVDVRVVTSGGHVYLRLPFSHFTELSGSQAAEIPNLARLFDPQSGLSSVLAAGKSPAYQGTEKVGDVDSDKITTSYTAAQVGKLLGITPAGPVNATIWAGQPDHMVRRVTLAGPLLQAGKNVQVQVDLHDFNRPVTITPPSTVPTTSPAP